MPSFRFALLPALIFALITVSAAQTAAPKSSSAVDNQFVQKEFGSSCTLDKDVPPLIADFNGDKIDDIVIAAHCKNPMIDAVEHKYTVLDPYNAFYGFGNPQIMLQYSTEDPRFRDLALLIIHGAGPDAWRSAAPGDKFLIVNLAYKDIAAREFMLKKKRIEAIYVDEADETQTTSVLYWDGKKYKYDPIGSNTN